MIDKNKVNFIKDWIQDYVDKMPMKAESLVIGISGGIDSSVSSTLCALTGMKTIVLSMPIKQKNEQHDLSLKHQKWLKDNFSNVEAHTIELDNLFGNPRYFKLTTYGTLTFENLAQVFLEVKHHSSMYA